MGAYGLAWPMGCKKVVWMSVHGLETGPADARFSRRLGSIETVSGELGWRGASWGLCGTSVVSKSGEKVIQPFKGSTQPG